MSSLLYLTRAEVESSAPTFAELREVLEQVFVDKGLGRTESPPKRGILPRPGSSIRAMKAYVPRLKAAGVKWVSAFPTNVEKGLPTISALVVLNDDETGVPYAVMDGTWITGARTAASTAIAAKHLARSESESAGVIACGLQGHTNLRAVAAAFPLRRVRAYDLDFERARAFAWEMSAELGLDIEPVDTVERVVREADIVVSSMPIEKHPKPPIEPGWLSPGSFACLLDFDAAVTGAALRETDRLVTDDVTQMNFFKDIGYLQETPEPDADLGKIAAGRQAGRTRDDERILCMNLGIGCLDVATARLVYERALTLGLGTELAL